MQVENVIHLHNIYSVFTMGTSRIQWHGAWIKCPKDWASRLSLLNDESISRHTTATYRTSAREQKLWWFVCFSEDLGTGLKADIGPGNDFANRYFSRSQQKNKGGGKEFWREGKKRHDWMLVYFKEGSPYPALEDRKAVRIHENAGTPSAVQEAHSSHLPS